MDSSPCPPFTGLAWRAPDENLVLRARSRSDNIDRQTNALPPIPHTQTLAGAYGWGGGRPMPSYPRLRYQFLRMRRHASTQLSTTDSGKRGVVTCLRWRRNQAPEMPEPRPRWMDRGSDCDLGAVS